MFSLNGDGKSIRQKAALAGGCWNFRFVPSVSAKEKPLAGMW
jgi:hypothetical protein